MMQGGSAISKDLPPFTVARGDNGICGLNTIGLRRAGVTAADRLELRRLYHLLFRGGRKRRDALEAARKQATTSYGFILIEFVASARRGICRDVGRPGSTAENDPHSQ
jgi:UDP-N-acetylglucosamine acyltransferase